MPERSVRVAVDAMGGDRAPQVVCDGVASALAIDEGLHIVLVGPEDIVGPFSKAHVRVQPVVATEAIGMGEHPAAAVRGKKDSSIVVACRLVRDGAADGFFSAGSTGACMAAATLVMGRLPGILRPALAAVIPASARPTVLLDVGANADCKPEILVQFAHMGRAYAQAVLGPEEPTVGLLNIGEEDTKGSQLAQEAHALFRTSVPGFVGNVEGRDIPRGTVDVVVTDGFTGNVSVKLMEGLASVLFGELKLAMTATPLRTLAAVVLRRPLKDLKSRLDPEVQGGAPLLGVVGVCIIGHGSSSPAAIASGIALTARAARGGLTERIRASLQSAGQPT